MAERELERLFSPRAVAVVGASEAPGRVGRIVFESLLRSGRPVYPVNPSRQTILGVRALHSPAELPDGVDLAVLTTTAAPAVTAAEECAARGVPFVLPVAGGFREAGPAGLALEERLGALARAGRCRVLGPNTLGMFLPHERLDTIFVEHGDESLGAGGAVAVISQSGSVGTEALGVASNSGFGMRAFVGLGNKCDLDELDMLRHFAADPGTRCLAFYIESLDEGRAFLEEARRISPGKPIVVLKAGRTQSGALAVGSHTGRLAGSDRVVDFAFRQFGVQRAQDDQQLCDLAKALAGLPPARGNRVAVLGLAGAYGVMGADFVESEVRGVQLQMARLAPETVERIRRVAVPFAAAANPVDLTASATDAMFLETTRALVDDPGVDVVIVSTFFAPPGITEGLVEPLAELIRASPKPVIDFTLYGPHTDAFLRRFHALGVVGYPSIERAVRAARGLWERACILASLARRAR
jgi:acetate---CoA ligase (ADP-forming)